MFLTFCHYTYNLTYKYNTNASTYNLQDLRGCLDAALEQVDTLRNHLQGGDTERRELEQKIQELRRENQEAKKALEESLRDSNRYRCSLEVISRYTSLYTVITLFMNCVVPVDKIVVDFILDLLLLCCIHVFICVFCFIFSRLSFYLGNGFMFN